MSDFNGGQSAVSMEELEAFLANQTSRPMFAAGTGAPPPVGGVEDPAGPPAGQFSDIPVDDPTATPPSPDNAPTGTQGIDDSGEDNGEGLDEEDDDDSDDDLSSLTPAQLKAYTQLDNIFRNDPRLQQILGAYLRGEDITPYVTPQPSAGGGESSPPVAATGSNTPAPPGTPPGTPDEINPAWLDDPVYRSLYNQQQSTLRQLEELQRATQAQQSIIHSQQEANTAALVNRATTSFQQQHHLTDQEIESLRSTAAKLNVVNSFMSGVDPITGAPVRPDPLNAVERALEIALYADPVLRMKEINRIAAQDNADRQRKTKLGAISGSSGSVPRTSPTPTTKEGRQEAMTREVADMLQGTWSSPE